MASVALDLNSGKATRVDGATWFTISGNTIEKAVTGDGADTLLGNSLANRLHGMRGNDILNGGKGKDTLLGGAGKDGFVFDAALKAANVDHVGDFLHAKDKLRLDDDVFKALDTGKLAASAFHSARNADEAKDAADRIVYDTRSGELRYDPDGKGGKAAILFAILDGSPDTLSARDFLIVA